MAHQKSTVLAQPSSQPLPRRKTKLEQLRATNLPRRGDSPIVAVKKGEEVKASRSVTRGGSSSLYSASCYYPVREPKAYFSSESGASGDSDSSNNAKASATAAAPAAAGGDKWTWGWAPPANASLASGSTQRILGKSQRHVVPVLPRQELTQHEVEEALKAEGGVDVKTVRLQAGRLENVTHMVFATGRSAVHLRRLADVIVRALKDRELSEAAGFTGAEGYDCDDWILVDCGNMYVQLMDARTRKSLQLEKQWKGAPAFVVDPGGSMNAVEARIDALVDEFPVPEDYELGPSNETRVQKRLDRQLSAAPVFSRGLKSPSK